MAEDKDVEKKEPEEPGVKETDDSVVVDFGSQKEPEKDPTEHKASVEEEEKKKEEESKEPEKKEKQDVDLEAVLAKVKDELRDELKPKDERKFYSEAELQAAEEELDAKLENGDITKREHRIYERRITALRQESKERELLDKWSKDRNRMDVEKNVTAWAKTNAPQFLDTRSKEVRDAEAFGIEVLGGEKTRAGWIFPEKIGQVMLGLLHASTTGKTEAQIKEAEKRGFEKGATTKETRREAMKKNDEPPAGSKGGETSGKATEAEKDVMEKLGFKNLALYRKFKGMAGNKSVNIEVA